MPSVDILEIQGLTFLSSSRNSAKNDTNKSKPSALQMYEGVEV